MARAETTIAPPHRLGFLATLRNDTWWVEPALTGVGMLVFFGWLTVSIFLDQWEFEIGPYLSPVFEPKLFGAHDSVFISPALIVLIGPIPFRATCYYYRRAYYRSWFLSPPACAVGDASKRYQGENVIPFWFNNLHRFAMYVALLFVPILWYGALRSFYNSEEVIDGKVVETGFGVGLGSAFLVINAFLLMMYTFSCHSLRHWVGGGLDCFSCTAWTRARKRMWDRISVWNSQHRFWAWTSLIWIVATDVYIRLVANGDITDPNTWSGF
jgi:hypothetical protein